MGPSGVESGVHLAAECLADTDLQGRQFFCRSFHKGALVVGLGDIERHVPSEERPVGAQWLDLTCPDAEQVAGQVESGSGKLLQDVGDPMLRGSDRQLGPA
jgi:hypothetical protein